MPVATRYFNLYGILSLEAVCVPPSLVPCVHGERIWPSLRPQHRRPTWHRFGLENVSIKPIHQIPEYMSIPEM